MIKLEGLDVILGVKWLHSIGKYTLDHWKMQLEFIDDKQKIELRVLSDGRSRILSAHKMEAIPRRYDIAWAAQCFVSSKSGSGGGQQHQVDIQSMLHKHNSFFGDIPLGRPPDHNLSML